MILAMLFFGVPAVTALSVAGGVWLGLLPGIADLNHTSAGEWSAITLLYLALAQAYILSYPAVQASSPSLVILLKVGKSMPAGLTFDDLLCRFDNESVLAPRIQDLLESNLVKKSNGALTLTLNGVILARSFSFFRRLLGLPLGKG